MDFIEDNAPAAAKHTGTLQTNNQEQKPLDTGDFSTNDQQLCSVISPERAKKLIANYPCCSIINGTKRPVGIGWQTKPISAYTGQGLGIICGEVVGYSTPIYGLDADIISTDAAKAFAGELESILPYPPTRVGLAPKFLIPFTLAECESQPLQKAEYTSKSFYPDGVLSKKDKCQLEVLGQGNQFIGYHIHPDTKQPYQWHNFSICDLNPEDLPVLTRRQLAEIKAIFIKIMDQFGLKILQKPKDAEPLPVFEQSFGFVSKAGYKLNDVLAYLPSACMEYDEWQKTLAAIHAATNGQGVQEAYAWSCNNKHEDGKFYTAWNSFGKYSGAKADWGSLITMAKDNGMPAINAPIADASKLFSDIEAPEVEQIKACDVDLLNPPGLAGEICKYMKLNARRDSSELYPLSALHLMALVGRKRKSILTDKLNLVTLGIAPTAAGKENAQDAVKRLAHDQHCSKYIHGNAGSFKELVLNIIDGHGSSLYVVDEIHSLLGSMKSKSAATYETKMEAEILTMTSTKLYTFRGMEKRSILSAYKDELKAVNKQLDAGGSDEEVKKLTAKSKSLEEKVDWLENGLPNPFVSLMGHSVPEKLDGFVSAENISSGFIGRTLVIRAKDTRSKLRRTPVDEGALTWCEQNIDRGLANVRRDNRIVSVDSDARIFLDECIDWFDDDEQLNHPAAGGIYARAPEHLYRVASILALDEGSITLEHAKYAYALVKHSIENIDYLLMKAYTDSDGVNEQHVIIHAKEVIHRNCKGQGLQLSRIKDLVKKPKGWKDMEKRDIKRDRFTELIELMLAEGELIKITDGRRVRYVSQAKG